MTPNDVGTVLVLCLVAVPLSFFAYCCFIAGLGMRDAQEGDGPPPARSENQNRSLPDDS